MSAAVVLEGFALGFPVGGLPGGGFPGTGGVRWIVDEVDLEIPCGALVLLVGPSGSGKSTLMTALLGLEDPYRPALERRGTLRVLDTVVDGSLPAALRGRVNAVFQDGALIDELSPVENVALALRERDRPTDEAAELLARVGLPHPPAMVVHLSGGERRRLALARALVGEPELLVLDEPTAGLDPPAARTIAERIREVHDAREGRTTIVITHNLEAFAGVLDAVLLLDRARGKIEMCPGNVNAVAARLEKIAAHPPGPVPVAPSDPRAGVARIIERGLLAAATFASTAGLASRHLLPRHPGMLLRGVYDQLIAPAPYVAAASFVGGGLATYFALANNPLEGGFQRAVLVGTGKALVGSVLPLLVALLFAARVSAGAVARLGNLRRGRVYDALPLLGISPHALLLNPLLLSSLLAMVALTALGIVSGCLASLVAARAELGITPFAWAAAAFSAVDGTDLRWAMTKALVAGLLTALTAYHLSRGPLFSARDIARATNGAIVWSTLWVLATHGVLTVVQYG